MNSFIEFKSRCDARLVSESTPRPANALNVEIGNRPADRCLNRKPDHWSESATGHRWIASGGGYLVFGVCCAQECPLYMKSVKYQHEETGRIVEMTLPGHPGKRWFRIDSD